MTGGWQLLKRVREKVIFGSVENGSQGTNEFFTVIIVATILRHNSLHFKTRKKKGQPIGCPFYLVLYYSCSQLCQTF